jgi:predicted nucleic acid-binding protein
MIIVSDTTPIISFLKINGLDILQKMYGTIVIPSAVYNEIISNKAFPAETEIIKNCQFIILKNIQNDIEVEALSNSLDKGESEAIILFEDLKADLLLVDERKARSIAKDRGITIVGTLGILIEAKRIGYVKELRPLLETLISNNIRINKALFDEIIKFDGQNHHYS